jgi:hypothetical protein
MAITVETLQADYEKAWKLYVSGVRQVMFNNRLTMYGGSTEIKAILTEIKRQIAILSGTRKRQTLVVARKGF